MNRKKKRSRSKTDRRSLLTGLAFISPWIVGFLCFTLYPIINSLRYSFTNYSALKAPRFVGLDNYKTLFTSDPLFIKSILNTGYMMLVGLPVIIIVTFIISAIVNDRRLRGVSFIRTLFFMPTLVPMVVLCILWIWLLKDNGAVNQGLALIGIDGPGWLASPRWAKPGMILMNLWCSGNLIIIFLAGLQDVPTSLYEAVEIDGGNILHKFRYITIPFMKPIIVYNVVTYMIKLLQQFTESFVMTNGGPNDSTTFFGYYLYNNAFKFMKMGYASAMAWIMLVAAMILTFVMLKVTGFGKEES